MDEVVFHDPRFRVRRLVEPELRKDPVVERWVIVSTDRLGRAQEVHAVAPPTRLEACPFCAGNEQLTPHESFVFPERNDWRVRVVPNAYPALRRVAEFRPMATDGFEGWSGWGVHEVVIECPHHESSLANLPADHIADLFRVYRQRILAGKEDVRSAYPVIFKNSGADAGASLEHAHSQIVLLPRVPLAAREELEGAARFWDANRTCVYCDLLEREKTAEARMVVESAKFTAFTAFAGRFPFETWIMPTDHASHFEAISDDQADDLAEIVRTVLRKLASGLSDPPYNYYIHTTPLNKTDSSDYHWHIEILPRLTGIAGFEWGTGFAINPVPPEQAAAYLRSISV